MPPLMSSGGGSERNSCLEPVEGHCQYQSTWAIVEIKNNNNVHVYTSLAHCGDGDVSAEFGSAKSAIMW